MEVARLLAPFETPLPPPRLCGIALMNPKTALRGTQYAGMMNRGNFGAPSGEAAGPKSRADAAPPLSGSGGVPWVFSRQICLTYPRPSGTTKDSRVRRKAVPGCIAAGEEKRPDERPMTGVRNVPKSTWNHGR